MKVGVLGELVKEHIPVIHHHDVPKHDKGRGKIIEIVCVVTQIVVAAADGARLVVDNSHV